MEPGESLEEVAKRELFEETSIQANELIFFNIYSGREFYYCYPHGDEVYNVVATYICKHFDGCLRGDSEEVMDVRFFYPNELPMNLSTPDLPMIREYLRLIGARL